jgi:hypothetical protein
MKKVLHVQCRPLMIQNKTALVNIPILKGIVSKLTIQFWMCQNERLKKMTTASTVE